MMYCIWWRTPGHAWSQHLRLYLTEDAARLDVLLVQRIAGGNAECVILPVDGRPE